MNFASKRKRDEVEPDTKKIKNFINEQDKQEYTTSNEWPIYSHPEGGIVKITPWGSLRQFEHPVTGEQITKFEDVSFGDISFNSINSNDIYDTLPSTPQSLYNQQIQQQQNQNQNQRNYSSPSNQQQHSSTQLRLSPSDEVESYVVDGYHQITPPPPSMQEIQQHNDQNQPQQSSSSLQPQFEQEQENYFGMMDQQKEEYEYNDELVRHYSGDEDVMM
ncbi:hypothetical protein DFJ63DRAFT_330048 [Scheffersomyces coipomensis]|uniref:uncharacterized protein n=1 Tax=Scheffersomyces coipomensis TaxID=1788519 RepID=UPI00315D7E04